MPTQPSDVYSEFDPDYPGHPTVLIRLVNHSPFSAPQPQTPLSSGCNLQADLASLGIKSLTLNPHERSAVPTGLHIQLPPGFEAQVRPRSGLALHFGLTVANPPGTIDADYTGEIRVILVNLSDVPVSVQHGDRIAQLVVAPVYTVNWMGVVALEETERGEGGLGSTGR